MMSFLGSAAAGLSLTAYAQQSAPPSPVRQDWLDRRKEPILESELPIVDPHHHLFVLPGWRYLLDEFLLDTGSGHNIIATVFVQAHSMYRDSGPIEMRPVGEAEFVNGIAAICASGYCKTKVAAGIVGYADLTLGSRVEPVLAALMRAGDDRFRGIRYITAWDADTSLINPNFPPAPPGLLADKTFREGFAVLSRLGLSFDALVLHPQLDDVANLARAFPDTEIVLNHIGRPVGKLNDVFPRWAASIKALAPHENLYIKVGGFGQRNYGLGFHKQAEPASSEMVANAMRPYVETCIEAFGTRRSMFESNFPVDKVGYGYAIFWNACKLLTKGASVTERADLFAGTAARFYSLNAIG
jgi:L-fuconolactonase